MQADVVIGAVGDRIRKFPLPVQGLNWGEEYSFPTLGSIPDLELSNWLSKLADWSGYALKMLIQAGIELDVLENVFDSKVAKATVKFFGLDKKPTKDYILGKILTDDAEAIEIRARYIAKHAEVEALRRLADLYALQLNAVSREISRRSYGMSKGF